MAFDKSLISEAFQAFCSEAPDHAKAWMTLVQSLREASSLDERTSELAFISVLSALGRSSGIPFHVKSALDKGASRDDVISAILIGLPAAGHVVTQSLLPALEVLNSADV
ncbi:carboxymuconolactone decarboxylase family protein [Candidatus Bipolaricaulota bacterium]|nr:carboxymuconolactone decarboxylase family protein [Candidatus Bipolaricaulota bacterium]TFH11220.1 MAG: carboxymuconolactone decarboxylase family protein [Candidatus Atribacteria bacterium]